jgi:hypothetical protein
MASIVVMAAPGVDLLTDLNRERDDTGERCGNLTRL